RITTSVNSRITVVSVLMSGAPSERNYLESITRHVIGYLIMHRVTGTGLGLYNQGSTIGTEAFYDTDGNQVVGVIETPRMDEAGVTSPLIDPIDLVAGPIADLVGIGARAFLNSFRAVMVGVERKLLARGLADEVAKIRVLTEKELSMVVGGGTA